LERDGEEGGEGGEEESGRVELIVSRVAVLRESREEAGARGWHVPGTGRVFHSNFSRAEKASGS
jgi:hypothetical protein